MSGESGEIAQRHVELEYLFKGEHACEETDIFLTALFSVCSTTMHEYSKYVMLHE